MALQEVHTGFTFNFDGSKLAAVQRGVKRASTNLDTIAAKTEAFTTRVGGAFQRVGQMVGAYVGYRAIRLLTTDYAKGADAIAKFATATGLATDTYQGLIHAVEIGGSDQENLNKALTQLSKRALEAGQGLQTNVRAFGELGISWTDAEGKLKSGDQLFVEMADGLVNLEDKEKRTGIAMQLLGRSGATLLPTLLTGSKGIKAMIVEAKKLGKVLSEEQLKAAEKFNDEMLRVKSVLEGVRNVIAAKVLPTFSRAFEAFRRWWVEGKNAERALRALKLVAIFTGIVIARLIGASVIRNIKLFVQGIWAGVQALRAMGIAGAATAIKLWAIIAAFALVAFAVEQLIGFARGQDTFLGRFLGDTKLAKKLKDALLDVWKAVKKAWKDIKPALLEAWKALKPALEDVWKALEPLIGPAFEAWITAIVIHLKIFTAAINGARDGIAWLRHELDAADTTLADWDKAINDATGATEAWANANAATSKGLVAIEDTATAAGKAIANAWDDANAAASKGLVAVENAARSALVWMGLVSGKATLISPEVLAQLKRLREPITRAALAPATSAGGPIMPGLQLPYGGLVGGPVRSWAPGPGFAPPPAQAVTANVATGAVQLTVHASGDPKAIAAQVAPLVKRSINAAFTDASRDLVKPPRGQS